MTGIHIGQGWDIEMQVNKRLPLIDDYTNTVLHKTGVFPRFLVKTIFALYEGENKKHLEEVKNNLISISDYLSVAFQIKDDLLNISDSELSKSKGVIGEDIFEGKYTLMVIHTLQNHLRNSERLKEILHMKTKDPELIKEAIEILRENNSIDFANKIMIENTNKAIESCDLLSKTNSEFYNKEVAKDIRDLILLLVNI